MDLLNILGDIFDFVRIVDPDDKKVEYVHGDKNFHIITHNQCYQHWIHSKVCDNCISLRALNENRSIVKFEVEQARTYMVIAAPIEYQGRKRAIELIKDVTENNIFEVFSKTDSEDYLKLIDDLNQYVITDELTQVYNKRFVMEHLPVDIRAAFFDRESIALVMADIDRFKYVNDTYGHVTGDEILKILGQVFKDNIRGKNDWVARYGGEEFLFVFRNTNMKALKAICERIRLAVEAHEFIIDDLTIRITISLGGVLEGQIKEVDEKILIELADQALYKAKSEGRNRTVLTEME